MPSLSSWSRKSIFLVYFCSTSTCSNKIFYFMGKYFEYCLFEIKLQLKKNLYMKEKRKKINWEGWVKHRDILKLSLFVIFWFGYYFFFFTLIMDKNCDFITVYWYWWFIDFIDFCVINSIFLWAKNCHFLWDMDLITIFYMNYV